MSQRLTTAIDELRAEETRIHTDLAELRKRVKTGEAQLKQIQRALCVLDAKPRNAPSRRKPAANRQEVLDAMASVLSSKGPLEEDELKRLVGDVLTNAGKSQMGLALRFQEAIADGRFVRDQDGWVTLTDVQDVG